MHVASYYNSKRLALVTNLFSNTNLVVLPTKKDRDYTFFIGIKRLVTSDNSLNIYKCFELSSENSIFI